MMNDIIDAEWEEQREIDGPFSMPEDMIDLQEYTENITMLVYGDSGVGKTPFAASANTLIVATENGTVSAAKRNAKMAKPPFVRVRNCIHNFDKVRATYEWIERNCTRREWPFDWVAIDTATEMQNEILRWVVNERVEAGTAKSLNPYKTELQEYGEMHEIWRDYVKKFNDLPCNIIWLAHAMTAEDAEGNDYRLPAFQGKKGELANWTAAQCHVYGHMTVQDRISATTRKPIQVREIQWNGTQGVRARDRFDVLPAKTVNKTLRQIHKMIDDGNAVTEEPVAPKKAPAKKATARAAATA